MTVVYLFFGVVAAALVTWYVVQKRRTHLAQWQVSESWIAHERYPRDGDVPPGTSRQEEGK